MTSEAKLKKLTFKRNVLENRLVQFAEYLEQYKETPNIDELSLRMDKIENILKEFENIQLEVENTI